MYSVIEIIIGVAIIALLTVFAVSNTQIFDLDGHKAASAAVVMERVAVRWGRTECGDVATATLAEMIADGVVDADLALAENGMTWAAAMNTQGVVTVTLTSANPSHLRRVALKMRGEVANNTVSFVASYKDGDVSWVGPFKAMEYESRCGLH